MNLTRRWRALPQPVRRTVGPTLLVLAAATLTALLGAGPAHVLAVLGTGLTLVVLAATAGHTHETDWSHTPRPDRDGARRDVSELGWSILGKDGRVNQRVVRRTRALAAQRLAIHGVDLADPADASEAARLLGQRVHRQLLHDDHPTPRTLQAWLSTLERLAPPTAPHERSIP
ncbi:hypothetical protein [Oerskovia flava]|uniref:hypothetical protein n=1 Tax=Oerskovia flava TaxID=2986422 RepID=UPI00223F05AF|nr:hypothetical protein [Oerskovia sp. JB1-3-2]